MKNKRLAKILIVCTILFLSLLIYSDHQTQPKFARYPRINSTEVKNIILLIGDGMGLVQSSAARIKIYGASGRLHLERMPYIGLMNTFPLKMLKTDSAAAATAMATGYKTYNGWISMIPKDKKKVRTILEACRDLGKFTGLIATSRITHATPAAFAAHVITRKNESLIAKHLLQNRVNVLFGGGRDYFIPRTSQGSKRKDNKNLLNSAREKGYKIIKTGTELNKVEGKLILGLFQMGPLTTRTPEPTLAELTRKALELLDKNPKGFFLMVEGSQIDWACHDNNTSETFRLVRLFDEAVKAAIDFAQKDQKTLVVVTGDHETGGMTVHNGMLSGKHFLIKWSSDGHTCVPLPVYAFGPLADRFAGMMDNTDIAKIMAKILKIKNFPALLEK